MPANVETLAYTEARGVPWHGIGTPVEELMTAEEAIVAAGLDWAVEMEAIKTAAGEDIDFRKAVVRQSDRRVLGVMGNNYQPVQNRDAFGFADAIVADTGNHFETAGALDGGRQVFLSMELAAVEPIVIEGDSAFKTYLVVANAHDGSGSLRGAITPIRTVCENTLNFAFAGASSIIRIRHSGNIEAKMAEARNVLGISIDYMRRFEQAAAQLIDIKVDDDRAMAILRDAFRMSDSVEEKGEESEWYVKHAATQTFDRYLAAPDLADFRGTGWGVVNAVAEYLDHEKSYGKGTDRDALDVKMTQVLWGHSQSTLNRTVALISPEASDMMDSRVRRQAASAAKRTAVAVG